MILGEGHHMIRYGIFVRIFKICVSICVHAYRSICVGEGICVPGTFVEVIQNIAVVVGS